MPRLSACMTLVAALLMVACEPERAPRPASSGPPANAEFVTDSPVAIIQGTAAAKGDAGDFIGKWNDERGWDGVIEAITEEKSGTVLRMEVYASTLIGGTYWILAIVGDNPGVEKGQNIRVQGKIREVSSKASGPGMVHRIVLEDARVLK